MKDRISFKLSQNVPNFQSSDLAIMAKLLSDRCPTAGPAARFLGNYYLFFTPLGVEECLS